MTDTPKLRAFVVDDEADARQLLRGLIRQYPQKVEWIGEASGIQEALREIPLAQPNLLLLDIRLAPGTGFDLLQQLSYRDFSLIFTSAYDEYAIRAIRSSALDFLPKPLSPSEFEQALDRAARERAREQLLERIQIARHHLSHPSQEAPSLALPGLDGFTVIKIHEISHCKADGSYTHFHLQNGQVLTSSRNLRYNEQLLRSHGFFRSHQSWLLNLREVGSFKKFKKGGEITLKNGSQIPLAERQKKAFLQLFLN